MKHELLLENLNCAHCASKIEAKISETEGFERVSFNFATKKLSFEHDSDNLIVRIQSICDSIEDGVKVKPFKEHSHPGHEHHEHCHGDCCGHDHEHEHEHGENGKIKKILLAASIALGIAALVVHLLNDSAAAHWTVFGLSLAATLAAGYDVFLKGVKNAVKLRIEETVLITIAVIAAFILGEYVEAAMVTILFSIGEFIEDLAVGKSRRDIEKLSKIRPDAATLLENGTEKTVAADSVEIGSTVIIKPHERVPLDGVVTKGSSSLDVSALTGESLPQSVSEGSEVLSGSMNGEGLLTIKTTKEFGDSTATRILRLVEDAAAQVYRALVVLVASCPCAIVISVPLAYFAGIGAASRMGVLIKGGKYLEALAKADAFVFDKTGTLTTGKITVSSVYAYNGFTEKDVLSLAAACEKYSSHPIAIAIKEKNVADEITLTDYREVAGCGTSAVYSGKQIACGNSKLLNQSVPEELKGKNAVYLIYDGQLIGALEISDALRPEAKDVLSQLGRLGIKQKLMLTGDAQQNAEQTKIQLGNIEYRAQLMPQDKLDEITKIRESGSTVCFVGDGINDAPVLSKSDCGIAMGLGSEAAIEAADAVLSSGGLTALPKAIRLARKTINTIRANIIFALAVKAAVIVLAFFGMTQMWMSVLADTGVCVACVLYTARLLRIKD